MSNKMGNYINYIADPRARRSLRSIFGSFMYGDDDMTFSKITWGKGELGGWNNAVLEEHGTYATAIAYGAVATDDLILRSTHITAVPVAQNVVGELLRMGTAGAHSGYYSGIISWLTTSHNSGGATALYGEVDITATAALAGNHTGLLAEINVTAGTITGAGKIEGILVDVNITAGVAIAQTVVGIEVDMRGIKADVAGETIGIKVTKSGPGNYLDYGMQFSNQFENTTAIINFDLTQGSVPCVLLVESGAHTITSFVTFTGITTYFADFSGGADGFPFLDGDTDLGTTCAGKIAIKDAGGDIAYINTWTN